MKKEQVEQIRIDVKSDGESVLSMLIHKDGTLNRQGNGSLPPVKVAALGMTDGHVFRTLLDQLDERAFDHAGIYDHPEKPGRQLNYSVVFLGEKPLLRVFEFRVGSGTQNIGELLPYFNQFIINAVSLTDAWYEKALNEPVKPEVKKKPWWKF